MLGIIPIYRFGIRAVSTFRDDKDSNQWKWDSNNSNEGKVALFLGNVRYLFRRILRAENVKILTNIVLKWEKWIKKIE